MSVTPQCSVNCHPYVSRTRWVSTPFPPNITPETQMAAQYPWWGEQWRTPTSPPLPRVFYPYPLWPREQCESSCDTNELCKLEPCQNETNNTTPDGTGDSERRPLSLLNPNWALTR